MRFTSFKAKNIGPFKSVDLDLESLPGPLVAIVGRNGAGKTVLAELMSSGAAYRRCPTRGTLASLATARDSFVEVGLVSDRAWLVRQSVDCVSGKGESVVLDDQGRPAFDDAKVSSHDQWARDNLPSSEVLYSSAVSVQKSGGFLDMGRADRMAVLLRVIGAERLERLAELARRRGTTAAGEVAMLIARVVDAAREALDVSCAQVELVIREGTVEECGQVATAAREALRRAELLAVDSQAAEEVRSRRVAAVARVADAKRQRDDVEERIANNETLVESGDAIRTAVARDAELVTHVATQQTSVDEARARKDAAAKAATESEAAVKQASRDVVAAGEDATRALARLEDKAIVEAAAGTVVKQAAEVQRLGAEYAKASAEWSDLQGQQLSHKDDRIKVLRDGLASVRVTDHWDAAACSARDALGDDDALVERGEQMPAMIAKASVASNAANHDRELAASLLKSAEKLAARQGEMTAAADDLKRAEAAKAEAQARLDAASPLAATHQEALTLAILEHDAKAALLTKLQDERGTLRLLVSRAPKLDAAVTRLEELGRNLDTMNATLATHEAELAGLPEPAEDGGAPDVDKHRAEAKAAEDAAAKAAAEAGKAAAQLERAKADAEKVATLKAEVKAAEVVVADWKKLAADVGRDGCQAAVVDAAVPTLNTLVADILTTCVGTRFSVQFTTERLTADGKDTKEALDLRVIDNVRGRDALAETYSGGEVAIVGEAVALALTVLGCECAGTDHPDLVRDETGAALDPENAEAYVRMLRHAAKLVGARHVFYVSHDRTSQDAADVQLVINNGAVEVRT